MDVLQMERNGSLANVTGSGWYLKWNRLTLLF